MDEDSHYHSAIAAELNKVGILFFKQVEYISAMNLFDEALKIMTTLLQADTENLPCTLDHTKCLQMIVEDKEKLHYMMDKNHFLSKKSTVIQNEFVVYATPGFDTAVPYFIREIFAVEPIEPISSSAQSPMSLHGDFLKNISAIIFNMGQTLIFSIEEDGQNDGFLDKALKLFNFAMSIGTEVCHPLVDIALGNNIGQILYMHGHIDDALVVMCSAHMRFQNRALEENYNCIDMERSIGYMITISSNIGRLYFEMGKSEEALDMCKNSIARILVDEPNHIAVSIAYYNIGLINNNQGDIKSALDSYDSFLDYVTLIPKGSTADIFFEKENSIKLAISLNCMAKFYQKHGIIQKVIRCYEQALIRGGEHFYAHIIFPTIFYNAGLFRYDFEQDFSRSLRALGASYILLKKIVGDNHAHVACILYDIGIVQRKSGDSTQAFDSFTESLEIRIKLFGKNHIEVAICLNEIADIYLDCCKYEKAIEILKEKLSIEKKVLGNNDPNILTTLCNIGGIHGQNKEFAAALEFYKEALSLSNTMVNTNVDILASIHLFIGNTLLSMGELNEASTFFIQREILIDSVSVFENNMSVYSLIGYHTKILVFDNKPAAAA